ncbi:DUF5808 domain-containing protein [Nocardioides terrisoli]|uniref:DUF5808 domain-containing protein n=1 Tax=Nocardioides terrisoli TaxID=3388267 RepID=UPI00287BAC0D|nr:DUF5808 domain-containing protein [Nocardioides marmorisolisilvae]
MREDDDRHWLAGTIYFNRDDPRILVPKKLGLGIGRTLNLGHPVSWLFLAAVCVFVVVMAVTGNR